MSLSSRVNLLAWVLGEEFWIGSLVSLFTVSSIRPGIIRRQRNMVQLQFISWHLAATSTLEVWGSSMLLNGFDLLILSSLQKCMHGRSYCFEGRHELYKPNDMFIYSSLVLYNIDINIYQSYIPYMSIQVWNLKFMSIVSILSLFP